MSALQVGTDFFNHPFLRIGEREGQMFFVKRVEIISNRLKYNAFSVSFPVFLMDKEA